MPAMLVDDPESQLGGRPSGTEFDDVAVAGRPVAADCRVECAVDIRCCAPNWSAPSVILLRHCFSFLYEYEVTLEFVFRWPAWEAAQLPRHGCGSYSQACQAFISSWLVFSAAFAPTRPPKISRGSLRSPASMAAPAKSSRASTSMRTSPASRRQKLRSTPLAAGSDRPCRR